AISRKVRGTSRMRRSPPSQISGPCSDTICSLTKIVYHLTRRLKQIISGAVMGLSLRKTVTFTETALIEGGKAAPKPLKLFAAAAVLKNPWAGKGFVEDLKPEIHAIAPQLGELLTAMIIEMTGSGAAV